MQLFMKRDNGMSIFARIVYGLVGLSAVLSVDKIRVNWTQFVTTMTTYELILISLLLIGGLNWLIVAISGDRNVDLFGIIEG
jgi:uncharacterized membrane protein YuzA (DUF378 family)